MKKRDEREYINSFDTFISITINTAQFYSSEEGDEFYSNDPRELRNFKNDCKKAFGRDAIKEYGGGEIELIITEYDFQKFAIIANEYDIKFDINDIVEF